jgi:hypothetical protein
LERRDANRQRVHSLTQLLANVILGWHRADRIAVTSALIDGLGRERSVMRKTPGRVAAAHRHQARGPRR